MAAGLIVTQPLASADQAALGKEIYVARCAQCHGERGEGVKAPALVGPKNNLSGYRTAQALFEYTRKVMPADQPGRLLEVEYWAVLSYILRENQLLGENTPRLAKDNAAEIRLDQ